MSLALLLTALITITSCGSKDQGKKTVASNYNDAEIAKILTTVNSSEIEMAEIVVKKGQNEKIKEYAQQMVEDHRSNNKKTKRIMVDADMDLNDNSVKSQSLAAMAEVDKKQLEYKEGESLDKEYIEDQIKTHKTVLTDLRQTLIPQASNEDLKEHLEETAKKIEEHLEHAQKLERQLL